MRHFIHDRGRMEILTALHARNQQEMVDEARRQFGGNDAEFILLLERYRRATPAERGELLRTHGFNLQAEHLALGVSEFSGRLLYQIARATRADRILELGSSTGLSTAWLAGALHDNGCGELIATEIVPEKVVRLKRLVSDLELGRYVRILAGDVLHSIASLQGHFGLVFLDVWARDYLPVLRAVEPLCRPGTVVLADNVATARHELVSFLDYVASSPSWSSLTLPLESGLMFLVRG